MCRPIPTLMSTYFMQGCGKFAWGQAWYFDPIFLETNTLWYTGQLILSSKIIKNGRHQPSDFKAKMHQIPFPVTSSANKLATSCCNGIWETTRHNRHNGLLPATTCYRFVVYVMDLLWTCYRKTGVMDFGLIQSAASSIILNTLFHQNGNPWEHFNPYLQMSEIIYGHYLQSFYYIYPQLNVI